MDLWYFGTCSTLLEPYMYRAVLITQVKCPDYIGCPHTHVCMGFHIIKKMHYYVGFLDRPYENHKQYEKKFE